MSDLPWLQLIRRLRQDTPRLVSEFMEILETQDGYSDSEITRSELEETAQRAFALFIDRLSGTGYDDASVMFTDTLGRKRARQGIRFENFMEAIRINFRILWRGLERAARPEFNDILITNGERVLDVVERYATEVQQSFSDELDLIKRDHENTRARWLRRLLSRGISDDELHEVATALSVPEDALYELIAVPESGMSEAIQIQLSKPGVLIYSDHQIFYAFRAHNRKSRWPDEIPSLVGGYIATVSGLKAFPVAVALAQRLINFGGTTQLVQLRDALPSLVSDELASYLRQFHGDILADFSEISLGEQERLFETLKVFMTNGSMQKTADVLYVHRNTVFKRFKRFHEITGLDLSIPQEAMSAWMTLRILF